jgi:hypothetical protein
LPKWRQPALPPPVLKCELEPLEMRLSNVHAGGSLQINGVHTLRVHEGNTAIEHVADHWIYRPGLPGGDTGWRDVRPWLKPGSNEIVPHLHNVGIPSGFLNLERKPSPLSMKVEVKSTGHSMVPLHSFTWLDLKPYVPGGVGNTRLTNGWFHQNVVCDDDKVYVPQTDRASTARPLPYTLSKDPDVRDKGWCKDTRAWHVDAKKWELAMITTEAEAEVERFCARFPKGDK